jgi:hypothetical protein
VCRLAPDDGVQKTPKHVEHKYLLKECCQLLVISIHLSFEVLQKCQLVFRVELRT